MKHFNLPVILILILLLQSCVSVQQHRNMESRLLECDSYSKLISGQRDSLAVLADEIRNDRSLLYEEYNKMTENYNQAVYEIDRIQNNVMAELVVPDDRYLQDIAPKTSYKRLVLMKSDTVSNTRLEVASGKVAFYCPLKMTYKETYTAIGFIADVISDEQIKARMIERIKKVERDADNVTLSDNNLLIEKIAFYKFIELRLDEASNERFEIKKVHSNDKQLVTDKMEGWQWKVTPVASEKRQELFLKVIVYDEDGNQDFAFTKTYLLDVNVDPFLFVHNSLMLFSTNPEWAFGAVITPVLTFFLGMYQRRKKQKVGTA